MRQNYYHNFKSFYFDKYIYIDFLYIMIKIF